MKWQLLNVEGDSPAPRYASITVQRNIENDPSIYIFGGRGAKSQCFTDIYCLKPETGKWKEIKPQGEKPSPRGLTAGCILNHGNQLFLFGGWDDKTYRPLNDVYIYDFDLNKWNMITKFNSKLPMPRYGHTTVPIPDTNEAIIFGGKLTHKMINDVYKYNNDQKQWQLLQPKLQQDQDSYFPPEPRMEHSAVIADHKMWVFGGKTELGVSDELWCFDLDTYIWHLIENESSNNENGDWPEPRSGHVAVMISSDEMLIYGGNGEKRRTIYNDIWIFNIKTKQWYQPNMEQSQDERSPIGRTETMVGLVSNVNASDIHKSSATVKEKMIIMFGGRSADSALRDMWGLHIEV
eukprot:gb/GECH01005782.1/.p1 GENE.gb/GECH01005782.1/~~gb/GECH01005782.1/.p1  ORF type:complete len:349 (+),score=80.59 gb/GECH01005782.1/:1-1047(+)